MGLTLLDESSSSKPYSAYPSKKDDVRKWSIDIDLGHRPTLIVLLCRGYRIRPTQRSKASIVDHKALELDD